MPANTLITHIPGTSSEFVRMLRRATLPKLLIILLSGVCFIFDRPAVISLMAQPNTVSQQLSSFFKRYQLLELDARTVLQDVRQSGRLSLITTQGVVEIVLTPHDMRGRDYRAARVGSGAASLAVYPTAAQTFKGIVVGDVNSQARFTIKGLIIREGKQYYLEPATRFSSSADTRHYVFYGAADVIYDLSDTCGVSLGEKVNAAKTIVEGNLQITSSSSRIIELATEADYEYVNAHGGAINAINEILSIMNQVEGVYEQELGLTFQIVYQNAWDSPADPYSSTGDSVQLLGEFRDYWNTHFTNVGRDMAHMWTGRNMGGVLGRGYQSVTCNAPTLSYGLSRLDDRLPLKYSTPAHEIAHNLGATHAEQNPECDGTIMRPTTSTTLTFCQFSRNEVLNYVNESGQCLFASSPSLTGRVTDVSGKPISGVNIQAIGSTFKITQTDAAGVYVLNDLLYGGSYQVTPVKQSYAFTPESLVLSGLVGAQVANFTVKNSPDGPVLVTDGSSNRAIAFDSVTLVSGPFRVFTGNNFSEDGRTRVLLIAYNAALLPGEDLSTVKGEAEGGHGDKYALTIESLKPLPVPNWLSQITIKLPAELDNAGDVLVSISVRGANSNKVLMSIGASANGSP
jgi:metallopeptidase family M12-like protein/carboxypeptidase family protein